MKKPSELTNKDIGIKIYSKEFGKEAIFIARFEDVYYRVLWIESSINSFCVTHDDDEIDDYFTLEKPKAKPIVDWSTISPWFKYVAMDADGCWFMYKCKPTWDVTKWNTHVTEFAAIPNQYAPKFGGDWKYSVVERPR